MLDSKYAPINLLKFGLAIPSMLAYGLISYISFTFLWHFIPYMF